MGLSLFLTAAVSAGTELKVYHIGNSVTDTLNYTGLGQLASQRQNTYTYGRHMIPGAPLQWIYQRGVDSDGDGTPAWNDTSTATTSDYAGFRDPLKPGTNAGTNPGYNWALPNNPWHVVTLQPFDRHIEQQDGFGDSRMIGRFINVTRGADLAQQADWLNPAAPTTPGNVDTKYYVYSRWPRRTEIKNAQNEVVGYQPFNFQTQWDRTYTGGWDGTNETRDYFEKLIGQVRTENPAVAGNVKIVPVGDVLYKIDQLAKAGKIDGLTDIAQVYGDGIHFGNLGSFIVGTTFYATLYKDSPVGLTVPEAWQTINATYTSGGNFDLPGMPDTAHPNITSEGIKTITQTIWDVVSTHPHAGVIPEPAALGVPLLLGGLLTMRPVRP